MVVIVVIDVIVVACFIQNIQCIQMGKHGNRWLNADIIQCRNRHKEIEITVVGIIVVIVIIARVQKILNVVSLRVHVV